MSACAPGPLRQGASNSTRSRRLVEDKPQLFFLGGGPRLEPSVLRALPVTFRPPKTPYPQAGGSKVLIVVEQTSTGFSAFSPDIAGCMATGVTLLRHLRRGGGIGRRGAEPGLPPDFPRSGPATPYRPARSRALSSVSQCSTYTTFSGRLFPNTRIMRSWVR